MTKVNYDLRPIDTENVINTRNRIRLSAILNIFGTFVYLSINSYFTQAHASWIHMFHLIIQPLVLIISILDDSNLVNIALFGTVTCAVLDVAVLILNFISVNRCLSEPTAFCFDKLYENGTWLALASWFLLFDFISATQILNFKNQLAEKDTTEKNNIEMYKINREVPTWNSAIVYANKIRLNNLFLFLFDVVYNITISTIIYDMPLLFMGMFHIFIDLYSYFTSQKSHESATYEILRIIYVISFVCNIIVVMLLLQMNIDNVAIMLSTIITLMFVIYDMIQILYSTKIIETLANYKKYKDNL